MYNFDVAMRVMENLRKEADLCFQNKCYIAALILYGSVLESSLLCMCFIYPERVRKTQVYKKKKNKSKRKRGIFLEFTLNDLINIAEELKWFPMQERIDDTGIFRDWVKWVQETRNLIHPARWLKPAPYFGNIHREMQKFSKSKYKRFVEISEETVSGIAVLLGRVVEHSLAQKLKYEQNERKH